VQKFGGEMALTKQDELLKCQLDENIDVAKIEIVPQHVDNTLHICTPSGIYLDPDEIVLQHKKQVVKAKMTTKTLFEKATTQLYNLESCQTTEKVQNIDLDLYQMEYY
jgi:hypothetical protein